MKRAIAQIRTNSLTMTTLAALVLLAAVVTFTPMQDAHAGQGRGSGWDDRWDDDRSDDRGWDDGENDAEATTTPATTTPSVATTTSATSTQATTTSTTTNTERDDWRTRDDRDDGPRSFRDFFESIGRSFDSLRRGIATTSTTTVATTSTTTVAATSTTATTTVVRSSVDRVTSIARTIGLRSADSAASVIGTFFPTNAYDTDGFDQETTWALSLMAIGSGLLGGLMVTGKVALGSLGSLFG